MFRCLQRTCKLSRMICYAQRPRPTPGNDPRLQRAGGSKTAEEPQSQETEDVEVVKLVDADVEGVARVEKDDAWQSDPGQVRLLALGDATALLLFAAVGRMNHQESLDVISVLWTAAPFLTGWFLTGPFLGAYAKDAQDGYVLPAALAAGKTWAVAVPVALALRSLERGYFPATPFIVVSAAATGTLMIGWRTALAAATTPEDQLTALERFKRNKSRKGSAGEFMQLLSSLTKRW